jgi:hypothetical protein
MEKLGCIRRGRTPHLYYITAAIRFGLCRFRSPLLTVSQLISFPLATQMFPFAEVHVPQREREKPEGSSHEVAFGNPRINRCMLLPEAYRSLPRPSSSSKPSHPPNSVSASDDYVIDERIRNLCTTIIASVNSFHETPASSFNPHFHADLHIRIGLCSNFFSQKTNAPRKFFWKAKELRYLPNNEKEIVRNFCLGGDPAAGSPTATLLRLLPRCRAKIR